MNSELIYKLADELTIEEVNKIVLTFEGENIRLYNSLVRLGDSEQLACATVMLNKPIDKETLDNYRFAYEG